MRLIFKNGLLKMEFLGMTLDIPDAYKQDTVMFSDMLKAINELNVNENSKTDSRFVFDSISGMPISFTLSQGDGVIRFSEWEVCEAESFA